MFDTVWEERYEIRQQLGKKAGRRTLLACDRQNQELVVIKLLTFSNDLEWDDLKLFEREAKTLKSLSHPAIPQYLDYFEVNSPNHKGFALVQTYIPANSLEEHLKAGRTFTESEVKEIAQDILAILTYLHRHQPPIIHRDIKPSNILLTNSSKSGKSEVYLVDFGSVQTLAARESATITVVGTYGYMPPEQFGGRAVPASDLYSLGATLIYLVTGTHPADLPQTDLRIEFERFANINPGFSRWLKWMTEPSLNRRLTSAEAALKALENPLTQNSIFLITKKPSGSKVILNKKANFLDINIFESGVKPHIVFLILFAIAWNSGIFLWTITALFTSPWGINIFFVLFSLPFWGVGIGMILEVLFSFFGKTVLNINQQRISLAYKLFGFKLSFRPGMSALIGSKYNSCSMPKQDIDKLELVYLAEGVPWAIAIWAGMRECQFGHGLTPPEIEWLAAELSEWLNLPIQPKKLPSE
ncbi:serine/threonine protein kinase [Aerosakkonemataceae cyanobacterium BLCC-F154]|uniref:Serine/threonine protein kinase n=1 Tax=Floridaenema fluviatile BLCC-F154 TaxID=3153640 RepID=A0ABV4YHB4_9CYAN